MTIVTVGLDIAKQIFQAHGLGVIEHGVPDVRILDSAKRDPARDVHRDAVSEVPNSVYTRPESDRRRLEREDADLWLKHPDLRQ